ncbi:MAG: saccharopine dehydrogenase NADP-binding domain-containing protein [Archangiaceae bacterium]|nr:saccharopine dehydrogenase NADP-binding domain-containing protein [Archangiaceae bacterium]
MTWALYGATGYTGPLIAERAVERGHRPVLMGRSEQKLRPLAEKLNLPFRAVSLDDGSKLRAALEEHDAVLHVAGPFIRTSHPMLAACLDTKTHYLDITGEPRVFKDVYGFDREANERHIALIPGVGFDVVPSSCLVAYVAGKTPNARSLQFALSGVGKLSPGTVKSAVPVMLDGGRVFRDGRELEWPLGKGIERIRFSQREAWTTPAPLSDLYAAFRSTQIPNVTAYQAISSGAAKTLGAAWPLVDLARPAFKLLLGEGKLLDRFIEKRVTGGDETSRAAGRGYLWARAEDSDGAATEAWLETPEGYLFTSHSAVHAIEQVLKLDPVGALAPSQAFGADFVLSLPGVTRLDSLPPRAE